MQTIFVMIKCQLGETYNVAAEMVDKIPQVSEVHSISGQYELLMKCTLDPGVDIGHFIAEHVQKVPGIKDTYTLITFKAFS